MARPRPLARPPVATIWEDPDRSSSMAGPMRTHYCGELRSIQGHQEVTLCAWVDRCRGHGGVIFIDLQDRPGTVGAVSSPSLWWQQLPISPRKLLAQLEDFRF